MGEDNTWILLRSKKNLQQIGGLRVRWILSPVSCFVSFIRLPLFVSWENGQ